MTAKHPMRVVANRTGLSPYLIRMWERRYAAVQPTRTKTNRRMYSDDDIERLILLRRARAVGESIGQMARLSNDELRHLVRFSTESSSDERFDLAETGSDKDCLRNSIRAIHNLDQAGLEACLLKARVTMEPQRYLERIISPLLEAMGKAWSDGRVRAMHEHLASSVVRSVLGTIVATSQVEESSPLMISTTPVGQQHELGALMATVVAAAAGWRIVYLGPNLPAEDIAAAARQSGARAVALSIVYPPDDPRIEIELTKLRQYLEEKTVLLVGGRAAKHYRAGLDSVGAEIVDDLKHFKSKLDAVRNAAGPSSKLEQP